VYFNNDGDAKEELGGLLLVLSPLLLSVRLLSSVYQQQQQQEMELQDLHVKAKQQVRIAMGLNVDVLVDCLEKNGFAG